MLMDNVTGWIRKLTDAGVAAIALAVVVQVIFGGNAAFLPGDVIATLMGIISSLGGAGLVGLLAAALLYKIFTR
jgi:membrane protein DedA with SNARE-associated domain